MSGHNLSEDNDPKSCYRRGYQHGAQAALDAVRRVTTDKLSPLHSPG